MLFGMFGIGPVELGILAVVMVLLFGSKLPKLAWDMGRSITLFKKGVQGIEEEAVDIKQQLTKTAKETDHAIRA